MKRFLALSVVFSLIVVNLSTSFVVAQTKYEGELRQAEIPPFSPNPSEGYCCFNVQGNYNCIEANPLPCTGGGGIFYDNELTCKEECGTLVHPVEPGTTGPLL